MVKSSTKTSARPGAAKDQGRNGPASAGAFDISDTYGEPQAEGGETHQTAGGDVGTLTMAQGIPVGDNQNSLKQGARGPTLIEDAHFREKMFHFDHERIPERVVHARGYGAHAAAFVKACRSLRHWPRELSVDLDAQPAK